MPSRTTHPIDLAYLAVGVAAADLLRPEELVFMTCVCIVNHGLSSLMREVLPPVLQQNNDKIHNDDDVHNSKQSNAAAAQHVNIRIREILGGLFYSLSLACLYFGKGDRREEGEERLFAAFPRIAFMAEQKGESLALLISMAFLFFDHIYAIVFCEPPARGSWAATEDLTSLAVLLYAQSTLTNESATTASTTLEPLSFFSTALYMWLIYRVVRPFATYPFLAKKQHKRQRIQVPLSKRVSVPSFPVKPHSKASTNKQPQTKCLLSDKAMTRSPESFDKTMLWEINGTFYDLSTFVNQHPGGKEALLLGRGRDCTALFESYHPFSKAKGRQVLEKFRVSNGAVSQSTETKEAASGKDYFYELLCQRVAKVLQENGVDPIRDRGATYTRSTYYLIIASALLLSGYYHAKVSVTFCLPLCLLDSPGFLSPFSFGREAS